MIQAANIIKGKVRIEYQSNVSETKYCDGKFNGFVCIDENLVFVSVNASNGHEMLIELAHIITIDIVKPVLTNRYSKNDSNNAEVG